MFGIFLDIETNGLNPFKHCPLEIAYKIVDVRFGTLLDQFESVIKQPYEAWQESDPMSLKINGFSWDEIENGNPCEYVKAHILSSFQSHNIKRGKGVFICQNPSFDRAFFHQLFNAEIQEELNWPYHWLDLASMYWVKQLHNHPPFPWEVGLSKNNIAAFYHLPKEVSPHRAMNGVNHLFQCYSQVAGFPLTR